VKRKKRDALSDRHKAATESAGGDLTRDVFFIFFGATLDPDVGEPADLLVHPPFGLTLFYVKAAVPPSHHLPRHHSLCRPAVDRPHAHDRARRARAPAARKVGSSQTLTEPVSSIWNGMRHLVALIHRFVARLAVISQGGFGKIAAGFVASIWKRR
jgi:hypothetical protein